jgi:hypothetical protein
MPACEGPVLAGGRGTSLSGPNSSPRSEMNVPAPPYVSPPDIAGRAAAFFFFGGAACEGAEVSHGRTRQETESNAQKSRR